MARNLDGSQGLNLLSLDGGGITGLSSLYILLEMMTRLQAKAGLSTRPEPYEYFDLIAGTGTGAISAVMLGRLRMPLKKVIKRYNRLVSDTFSDKKLFALGGSGTFKATKFEEGLKKIVRKANGDENEMMMEETPLEAKCKVVIYAMSAHNMNASLPCAFRTYPASADVMPDCPIWRALRASTAHPQLFKNAEIDDLGVKLRFIDGAFGCSNPTAQLLKEASMVFPDRFVSSVTSIGAGHARTISIPQPSSLERMFPFGIFVDSRVLRAAHGIARDNEKVANEMGFRFSKALNIYYRLNVDQGMQSIEASEWEKRSEVVSHSKQYLQHSEVSARLDTLVAAIHGRSASLRTAQIDGRIDVPAVPASSASMGLKHCPPPTPMFKGRKLQLKQAHEYFGNEELRHVFVLHGPSGAGKTQAALKLAELMADEFEGVLFINGSSRDAIETALGQFAMSENLGKGHIDALRWLESRRGRWLMLFDNVDDLEVQMHEYFPRRTRYDVLITTRHQVFVSLARGEKSDCKIEGLEKDEGLELLLEAARLGKEGLRVKENDAATHLLQELGYLALAITQCGTFIYLNQCGLAKYYQMYCDKLQATTNGGASTPLKIGNHDRSLYTTWAMNNDRVSKKSRALWQLISLLDRNGISEEIFRRAYEGARTYEPQIPPTSSEAEAQGDVRGILNSFNREGTWSSRLFSLAMGDLVRSSLVAFDTIRNVYQLHPLVQHWAQTTEPKPSSVEHASFLLALSIYHTQDDGDQAFRQTMAPHVNEILDLCSTPNSNDAWQFTSVYRETGHLSKAEKLYVQVLDERKRALGEDHPDTLQCMAELAETYKEQGRLAEAAALEVELLAIREGMLGENHSDTLICMENLAMTYYEQDRLTEAESLELKILAIQKRELGENHPNTLMSMSNLAMTYFKQGRLAEAESLEVEVLAARKHVLGKDHPNTLMSMDSLAATYYKQGRLTEAEPLEIEMLSTRKRVLGEDHPDTLTSMANLAATCKKQGRLAKAEMLEVEVLAARKRALRKDHPDTLASMVNLAATYKKQGHLAKAEPLEAEVLAAQKRVLLEDHPNTLASMASLAATYKKQGRLAEAEPLEVEVLATRRRVLGEGHPNTLMSIANVAMTCYKQGRLAEAESLEVEALAGRKRVLGQDHPNTLTSMSNLAMTYYKQGRLAEAASLKAKALDGQKRVLGGDHPDTLISAGNLAMMYYEQGRLAEAELMQVEVLAGRRRVFGDNHPDTLTSMANLAMTYFEQGRLAKAESLEVEVLATRKRVLGNDHPNTLTSMANLATTYEKQGRPAKAEPLEVEALAGRKRVLGDDHPNTLMSMEKLVTAYKKQGRLAEAEPLEAEMLAAKKRVLGEDHSDTLRSMASLAVTYKKQGRLEEAESLQDRVLAARKRVLGESHPKTLMTMRNLARTYAAQGRQADHKALMAKADAIAAQR